jgi:hypothetical protein
LDRLATALSTLLLCHSNYLVASCSLHNLQLCIAKPIKDTMGKGGLDKRNVMQLLHLVYDLEESMTHEMWEFHVSKAYKFPSAYCDENVVYNGITQEDNMFASKWNKVKTFQCFDTSDANKRKALAMYQVPVATRWWTVGDASLVVFNAYLLLVKLTQSVINSSSGKSNKIASGLQPLLLEPEIYSNLALLTCYHFRFVIPRFGWMQSETDLTGTPGFQSHNTLVRYFLMQVDLNAMKSTITTNRPAFEDFCNSLRLLSTKVAAHQVAKVNTFVKIALATCHKHFKQWMSKYLLQTALLSEVPIASIVANAMIGHPLKETFEPPEYASPVHKMSINLKSFQKFVRDGITVGAVYHQIANYIADEVLQGVVVRDLTMGFHCTYKTWLY